jgi:hypothetical protein
MFNYFKIVFFGLNINAIFSTSRYIHSWRGLCPAVDCSKLMMMMLMMIHTGLKIQNKYVY